MADRTASEVIAADWMSPGQAIEIFDATFGKTHHASRDAILQCLRGKQIAAITATTTFHPDHSPTTSDALYQVPSEDWERVDWNDQFWITGILVYRRRKNNRSSEMETVRHFDVRFKRADVLAIVAPHQRSKPTASEAVEVDNPADPAAKKPPVSEGHLRAWHELYLRVYGGTPADTLVNAVASARGMFPDRFVSRESVRRLAGGRSPGRKTTKKD